MAFRSRLRLLGGVAVALAALSVPAGALAQGRARDVKPLGVPVPREAGLADITSTTSEGGDAHGLAPGADLCRSAPFDPVSLPADDAPHDDPYLEFWQWPITVEAEEGRRFAMFVTFENKPWAAIGLVQYTITDLSDGTFHVATERLSGPPVTRNGGYLARNRNFHAEGGGGRDRLRFELDGYEVDLRIREAKPPVLQLGDGHVTYYCNEFNLYSRYRMKATGVVRHAGRAIRVRGTSSFDHMWGFYPGAAVAETMALKMALDDGRDLFVGVARLPRSNAFALRFGATQDAEGQTTTLHSDDFSATPVRGWRRDSTCAYPVEWDVRVAGLQLHVRPVVDAAELRTTDPIDLALWPEFPAYWDGEVVVSGDATGRGWLDLTHYCVA